MMSTECNQGLFSQAPIMNKLDHCVPNYLYCAHFQHGIRAILATLNPRTRIHLVLPCGIISTKVIFFTHEVFSLLAWILTSKFFSLSQPSSKCFYWEVARTRMHLSIMPFGLPLLLSHAIARIRPIDLSYRSAWGVNHLRNASRRS